MNIAIVNSELLIGIREFAEALDILYMAKMISINEKRLPKMISINGKMADIYFNCSEWDKCLNSYKECIESIDDKEEHKHQLSILYSNVAVCLKNLKKYQESLQYKKMALEKIDRPEDKFDVLVQMGEVYIYSEMSSKRAKLAINYFEQAKEISVNNKITDGELVTKKNLSTKKKFFIIKFSQN